MTDIAAIAADTCAGDGLGNPSTCQIHMDDWYRDQPRCETVLAARRSASAAGGRLEFGVHRLPPDEAETAPAWPSLAKWGAAIRRRSLGR